MPTKKSKKILHSGPRTKVEVTQDIIDNAIESNSSHCVVADALKAALVSRWGTRYKRITVDMSQIRITDTEGETRFVYFTPQVCQRAIAQFDQGLREHLTPFKFTLGAPVQAISTRKTTGLAVDPKKSAAGKKGAKITSKRRKAQKATLKGVGRRKDGKITAIKVGGKPIRKNSPLGHRRQFGMKGLGNLEAPTAE